MPVVRAFRRSKQRSIFTPGEVVGPFSTTMTLKNESGVNSESSWVTLPFGQGFKRGHIPSGSYPRFRYNGTVIPYSWWGRNTYEDGSWRFAGFMLRIPSSLSNGATMTIDIDAITTPPNAASVALSSLYAAQVDIEADSGGLAGANITGAWIANLQAADIETIEDLTDTAGGNGGGNVCKYYRLGIPFKQGGTEHTSLYCYAWVFLMENDAGGLYDIAVMPGVCMPWTNKPGDTDWSWVVFNTLKLRRAAGTVTVQQPVMAETSFAWRRYATSSTAFERLTAHPANSVTAEGAHKWGAYKLTTSGTLPSGLNTNTVYGASFGFGTVGDTSVWNPNGVGFETGLPYLHATMLDGGVGAHTATAIPFISRSDMIFICPSTGGYSWLGAGTRSTAAPISTSPKQNMAYMIGTRHLPPLDLSDTATDPEVPKYGYQWGFSNVYVDMHEGNTGWGFNRTMLGPIHECAAEFIHKAQSLDRHNNHIISGLWGACRQTILRDYNTRLQPGGGWHHDSPASFGAAVGQSWYGKTIYASNSAFRPTGCTMPIYNSEGYYRWRYSRPVGIPPWGTLRDDHASSCHNTQYLLSGRDELLFNAKGNIWVRLTAISTQAGIAKEYSWQGQNWHSMLWTKDSYREIGWSLRDWWAYRVQTPDNDPMIAVWDQIDEHRVQFLELAETLALPMYNGSGYMSHERLGGRPLFPSSLTGAKQAFQWGHPWYYFQWASVCHWLGMFPSKRARLEPMLTEMAKVFDKWCQGTGNYFAWANAYGAMGGAQTPIHKNGPDPFHGRWLDYENNPDYWKLDGNHFQHGYDWWGDPAANYSSMNWNGATDTITWPNFPTNRMIGIANGDPIMFTKEYYFYTLTRYGANACPNGVTPNVLYYMGNVSGNSFKLYRDEALTDLVDIGTQDWLFLTMEQPAIQAFPVHAYYYPACTSSSGGVGVLQISGYNNIAFGRNAVWGEVAPDNQTMAAAWIRVTSGTFNVGDTFTIAGGGQGIIKAVYTDIPMEFQYQPRGLGMSATHMANYSIEILHSRLPPYYMAYLTQMGKTYHPLAKSRWETLISSLGVYTPASFLRISPRFRMSDTADWSG